MQDWSLAIQAFLRAAESYRVAAMLDSAAAALKEAGSYMVQSDQFNRDDITSVLTECLSLTDSIKDPRTLGNHLHLKQVVWLIDLLINWLMVNRFAAVVQVSCTCQWACLTAGSGVSKRQCSVFRQLWTPQLCAPPSWLKCCTTWGLLWTLRPSSHLLWATTGWLLDSMVRLYTCHTQQSPVTPDTAVIFVCVCVCAQAPWVAVVTRLGVSVTWRLPTVSSVRKRRQQRASSTRCWDSETQVTLVTSELVWSSTT